MPDLSQDTELVERSIYIAGPMSGLPEHNFPAFAEAAAHYRAEGHTVHSPAEWMLEHHEAAKAAGAEWVNDPRYNGLLGNDLKVIRAECNTIALLPGWERSGGARTELALALYLQLEIWTYTPAIRPHVVDRGDVERLVEAAKAVYAAGSPSVFGKARTDLGIALLPFIDQHTEGEGG